MPDQSKGATDRYVRRSEVLDASLGAGETVLLHPERGHYFGLKGTSLRIWELLAHPVTLVEICETLVDEFEVSMDVCRADTEELLSKLLQEELIELSTQPPPET